MKSVDICCLDSPYTLMLYLLKKGYNKNDIFIFTQNLPKEIRYNFNYIFFYHPFSVHVLDYPWSVILKYTWGIYSIIKLNILLFIKTFNKQVFLYGNADIPPGYIFGLFKNGYIFEDGIINYYDLKIPKKNKFIEKALLLCGIYSGGSLEKCGTHPNIKKVYLTQNNYSEIIKDKVEVINIKELWNNKSKKEQEEILSLFNFNKSNFDFKDNVLLLTQPFSEDNILSFEEEMKIYQDIINQYDNIIIKPHPRETKNYNDLFPNIKIIESYFPIELLKLIGIKFNKVVSVNSTALYNFKDYCDVEIYKDYVPNKRMLEARDNLIKLLDDG